MAKLYGMDPGSGKLEMTNKTFEVVRNREFCKTSAEAYSIKSYTADRDRSLGLLPSSPLAPRIDIKCRGKIPGTESEIIKILLPKIRSNLQSYIKSKETFERSI